MNNGAFTSGLSNTANVVQKTIGHLIPQELWVHLQNKALKSQHVPSYFQQSLRRLGMQRVTLTPLVDWYLCALTFLIPRLWAL